MGFALLCTPLAFANAASLSVQSISPGTTVFVSGKITFSATVSGFFPQFFQLTDSFHNSTASVNDFDASGNFSAGTITAALTPRRDTAPGLGPGSEMTAIQMDHGHRK